MSEANIAWRPAAEGLIDANGLISLPWVGGRTRIGTLDPLINGRARCGDFARRYLVYDRSRVVGGAANWLVVGASAADISALPNEARVS